MKTFFLTALLTLIPYLTPSAEAAHLMQGTAGSQVQLVIYGDVQCPFTAKLMGTLDQFAADFGDRVAISFAHFPLAFHANARGAAIAAECASEQGSFVPFLRAAFKQQNQLDQDSLVKLAAKVGVRDVKDFERCLGSTEAAAAVDADRAAAAKLGVNATPISFLGSEKISGAYPYEYYKGKVEKILGK